MSQNKNYVGTGWSRQTQYGEFINLSLNLEKLKQLTPDQYGNVKLTIGERRQPDERSKATHWVAEDTYQKPDYNSQDFKPNF